MFSQDRRLRAVTLISTMLCLSPQLASAQLDDLVCDDSARMEEQLISVVGAEKQGWGLRDPEALLEIWIVPETGAWTVVQNYANGTSCIMAMGAHWQEQMQEPA